MPLYEFRCPLCTQIEEHWLSIKDRNRPIFCYAQGTRAQMKRLPGGKGMLYYEEGRARRIDSLSKTGKPFTSYAQVEKAARAIGAVQTNEIPPSIRNNPKSEGMKRYLNSGKSRGKWV